MGVGDQVWTLPRSRALWIPADTPHTVDPIGAATMTTLWFDPTHCPLTWPKPAVVEVDDLFRALVARLDDADLSAAERSRSEAVLFDLLRPMPTASLDLPIPADDRARRVADALLAHPSDTRTLSEWGRAVGASDRTLMRCFMADTGLSFQEWRTRARITASLPHLAMGVPVAVVAATVGYATASAFGAAFRRTMRTTPSAYFGQGLLGSKGQVSDIDSPVGRCRSSDSGGVGTCTVA
jgi:AraC-like DNA-binding protein